MVHSRGSVMIGGERARFKGEHWRSRSKAQYFVMWIFTLLSFRALKYLSLYLVLCFMYLCFIAL